MSKANEEVRGVLFSCIDYHSNFFKDYPISIVTDEGSKLNQELMEYINRHDNVRLLIVPEEFKVSAVAKGRAIDYYIKNMSSQISFTSLSMTTILSMIKISYTKYLLIASWVLYQQMAT